MKTTQTITPMQTTWRWIFLGMLLIGSLPCYAQFKEEFRKELPLAANGRFSLSNINGKVIINAWEGPLAAITAVKEAPSQERMSELSIEIKQSPDRIDIETVYPKVQGQGFSVQYQISLPKTVIINQVRTVNGSVEVLGMTAEVQVSTVNGKVNIQGCSGRIKGETVNGSLNAELTPGLPLKEADLKTVNGSLTLMAGNLADMEVSAETLNGSLKSDYPFEIKKNLVGKSMRGTHGNGSTKVTLKTVNGSIHLNKSSS